MKVLYVVSTLKRCGPINQLYGMIKYLNKSKFKPIILTLSEEDKDSKKEDFLELNVDIQTLSIQRSKGLFEGENILKNKIENINPDIIYTSGIRPDYLVNSMGLNIPVVSTLRNYPYDDYPDVYGKIKGTIMAYNHIRTIGSMKNPVSCSYSISKKFKVRHNIKTNVIQNGVDGDIYKPIYADEKVLLRLELGLDDKKLNLITTGSLIDRKNPLMLIEAFKESNISKISYLIVLGDGPLMKECQNIKTDNIKLLGNVKNVVQYLQASDLFVSASISEGLPNAVLEAMAAELPVILSDIDQHMEILDVDSRIGMSFKVNDKNDLIQCLNNIDSMNLKYAGNIARDIYINNFSSKIMSENYQKLYLDIINKKI